MKLKNGDVVVIYPVTPDEDNCFDYGIGKEHLGLEAVVEDDRLDEEGHVVIRSYFCYDNTNHDTITWFYPASCLVKIGDVR